MPEVAQRVRGDGETAIVGESLAGLFVLETFFETPTLFDTYIALSPSLWWNDQALVHAAGARLAAEPSLKATLYFASASDDGLEDSAEALVRALHAHAPTGLRWSYQAWPKLKHSTIYRGASPAVFRKLFPPR
jgi:predicted alpha/beta superfamily hydrolase